MSRGVPTDRVGWPTAACRELGWPRRYGLSLAVTPHPGPVSQARDCRGGLRHRDDDPPAQPLRLSPIGVWDYTSYRTTSLDCASQAEADCHWVNDTMLCSRHLMDDDLTHVRAHDDE